VDLFFLIVIISFIYYKRFRKIQPFSQQNEISIGAIEMGNEKIDKGKENAPFDDNIIVVEPKKSPFQLSNISVGRIFHYGPFGAIFQGEWDSKMVLLSPVFRSCSFADLLLKAEIFQNLFHDNIMKFYGLYHEDLNSRKFYFVTEFLPTNLESVFLSTQNLSLITILKLAYDIASAMILFAQNNIVYGDFRYTNFFVVGEENNLKIKVAIPTTQDDDEFKAEFVEQCPRWCPPEILQNKSFSTQSDVWCFGVILWQMLSCGRLPYSDITDQNIVNHILLGYRLIPPKDTPASIRQLLIKCFEFIPSKRLTFPEIQNVLKTEIKIMEGIHRELTR